MTTRTTFTLALGLWATLAAAQAAPETAASPAAPAEPVRTIESDLSVGAALKARIDLTIGDVVVHGEAIDRIALRLLIFCEKRQKDQKFCDDHARDLEVKGDDLIAATQGRAIWLLDGLNPLRELGPQWKGASRSTIRRGTRGEPRTSAARVFSFSRSI